MSKDRAILLAAMLVSSAATHAATDEAASTHAEASVVVATSSAAPSAEPAAAKTATTPGATNSGARNRLVEEVIVTAQKREEAVQDVPISIQAFSAENLEARGVENTNQLTQSVAGMNVTSPANFALIYLRGIGSDTFIPSADPSVATYIDGIYLPPIQALIQPVGNVTRIEVLKGPQGTLFGRNSTGGAISVVTEDPGDVAKTSVKAEVGSFNRRLVSASLTNPVTDWLSFSVVGLLSEQDNYYHSNSYDVMGDYLRTGRVKVRVLPADDMSIVLTAFRSDQSGVGTLLGNNTNPSLLGRAVGIQPAKDNYTSVGDLDLRSTSYQRLYYGNFTWNLPWLDFKVYGSDMTLRSPFNNIDYDGSALPIAAFDGTNNQNESKTLELQFLSSNDSWLADRLTWVAGFYYIEGTLGYDPAHLSAAPEAIDSIFDVIGLDTPSALRSLIDEFNIFSTPADDGGITLGFHGLLGTESYSWYAQGTYAITETWDLTLGGRYQTEKRFMEKSETRLVTLDGNDDVTLISFPLEGVREKNFSPKAVLSWHPDTDTLVYASYASGFKSGTYNIVNIYTPPRYIVPEKVTSYELGTKLDLLDGLLRLNAAVFYNDIENLQTSFVSLFTGGAVSFQSAKGARTKGAELDSTLVPFPNWNPGLALTTNVAYVDGIYTDFKDGDGFQPPTGVFNGSQDFTGNRIVNGPKVTGGIGAVQSLSVPGGVLELAVDQYYNSGFYFDSANNVKEDAYKILNARASYLYEPWGARITVFGRNLLDTRYHLQQFQTDFGVLNTLAPPSSWGVRLNWDF